MDVRMSFARRILFSLASFFALSFAAMAEEKDSPWRAGFQLGINIGDYSTDPDADTSSRVGYIGGAEVEYELSPVWSVQQEVRLIRKGFTYETQGAGVTDRIEAEIHYLEIPLLMKAKFNTEHMIQPFAFVGPNLGFKIADDVTRERNGVQVGPDLTVLFKTIDFALDGGVGLEYRYSERMAGFGSVRGSLGLTNVSELSGTSWKSRGLQIVFGALFDL